MTRPPAVVVAPERVGCARPRGATIATGALVVAIVLTGGLASLADRTARGGDDPGSAPATSSAPAPVFTDVAAASGIDFVHDSGASGEFLLPEIMGGGCGFLDYDGDGLLDVYLVQSGPLTPPRRDEDDPGGPIRAEGSGGAPVERWGRAADGAGGSRLYRNVGDGHFVDVTERAGVAGYGYGMGCAAGDFDNDGDVDLYVLNLGANILYRNNGDGTFTDVTGAAGVGDPGWSVSAAFVDFDADGDLDLFVVNYVAWADKPAFMQKKCFAPTGARDYCSPLAYNAPSFDTLYRNNGDGTFTDVSGPAGIRVKAGTGLGIVCSDLNDDGRVDVYVANDQMPSFLWLNQGDGTFLESATRLGCAVNEMGMSQAGMGVDAADVDDDGDFDLWKVHLHRESHILYVNHGTFFDDATGRWNVAAPTRRFTGFGTALFDYDLDGLLDAFVACGRVQFVHVPRPVADPYAEDNQLLRQVRPGRFEDVSAVAGPALQLVETSRGAAFGDYDNDGDVDVLIANKDGPPRLLRNDAPRRGGFCTIRVLDGHGRDALGARLSCRINGRPRTFEVRAAYSYAATNDPRVHVGLGRAERIESVEVRAPGRETLTFGPLEADRFHVLRLD